MRCSGATALQPPTMVLEFLARQLPCHESYDSIAAIGTGNLTSCPSHGLWFFTAQSQSSRTQVHPRRRLTAALVVADRVWEVVSLAVLKDGSWKIKSGTQRLSTFYSRVDGSRSQTSRKLTQP